MARSLASKPNVVAPGGNYPYGRIKNKSTSSSTDGTPISEQVYGDMHQFFEKLLADAGITANGQPENAANGFQYNTALMALIGTGWQNGSEPSPLGTGVTLVETFVNRYRRQGKTITWNFCASMNFGTPSQTFSISLPVAGTIANGYAQMRLPTGYPEISVVLDSPSAGRISLIANGAASSFQFVSFCITFELA